MRASAATRLRIDTPTRASVPAAIALFDCRGPPMLTASSLAELIRDQVHLDAHLIWALSFGALAAALTVVSNLMKRMVPLRAFALVATALFIVYSSLMQQWVSVVLQVALLFINAYRLWDLRRLLRQLARARADMPLSQWLLPHMKKKHFKAGHVLFRKGDRAHQIVYIAHGTVIVQEVGEPLGSGTLVGEIGLFSADRRRTATIVCQTDCECYTMTDEAIYLLYFQNPKLGFYLIRLIVQRLLTDLQRRAAVA